MKDEISLIQALSMDLLRAAIGLNRNSVKMAETFRKEAEKRMDELVDQTNNTYLTKLVTQTKKQLETNKGNADNLLMYSVLFKNYALNGMKNT
jgi:hypothetical protein